MFPRMMRKGKPGHPRVGRAWRTAPGTSLDSLRCHGETEGRQERGRMSGVFGACARSLRRTPRRPEPEDFDALS